MSEPKCETRLRLSFEEREGKYTRMTKLFLPVLCAVFIFTGCQSAHLPPGSRKTEVAPTVTGKPAIQLDGSSGAFNARVKAGESFSVTLPGGEAEGYGGYEWILRDTRSLQFVRADGQRVFVEPSADLMVPAYYEFPFVAVSEGQQTLVFDLIRPGMGAHSPERTAVVDVLIRR